MSDDFVRPMGVPPFWVDPQKHSVVPLLEPLREAALTGDREAFIATMTKVWRLSQQREPQTISALESVAQSAILFARLHGVNRLRARWG